MSGNGNGTSIRDNGSQPANGNGQHAIGNHYRVPTGRAEWIVKRKQEAARTGDANMSQMHFARKGLITEEMAFVAQKEKIAAELVRSEIAKASDGCALWRGYRHGSLNRRRHSDDPRSHSAPLACTHRHGTVI